MIGWLAGQSACRKRAEEKVEVEEEEDEEEEDEEEEWGREWDGVREEEEGGKEEEGGWEIEAPRIDASLWASLSLVDALWVVHTSVTYPSLPVCLQMWNDSVGLKRLYAPLWGSE